VASPSFQKIIADVVRVAHCCALATKPRLHGMGEPIVEYFMEKHVPPERGEITPPCGVPLTRIGELVPFEHPPHSATFQSNVNSTPSRTRLAKDRLQMAMFESVKKTS